MPEFMGLIKEHTNCRNCESDLSKKAIECKRFGFCDSLCAAHFYGIISETELKEGRELEKKCKLSLLSTCE